MAETAPSCRLCGAADALDLGAIPDSDYFAGRVLSAPLPGGRLYRCATCRSMFRHPVLSSSQYLGLYKNGVATQWAGGETREDLRLIAEMLTAESAALCVLDIGCGTGDFLASLPQTYAKFGVEPSAAAIHAERRGVSILAAELAEVAEEPRFDVITIIDVIEHFPDPAALLAEAYMRIRPGGKIIVSTGDPEASAWTAFGPRFWYVSFPEHVSFPSMDFCTRWGEIRRASAYKVHVTRYHRLGVARRALSFVMQCAFYLSSSAFSWVGRTAQKVGGYPTPRRQSFAPGVPGLFTDHQILKIEKPAAREERP